MFDVVVVGAGPAGLSAALMLGRCRRHTLLCDSGEPPDTGAHAMHGFLSRDGIPPAEFRQIGREQLQCYPDVEWRSLMVLDAIREESCFTITLQDQTRVTSRALLLATGVIDELPAVPGLKALYGTSAFYCPFCDGWEVRDQPLAIYGTGKRAAKKAITLLNWSRDLVICSDGPGMLDHHERELLLSHGIALIEEPIARLEGTDGQLEQIVFASGDVLARRALFLHTRVRPRSQLAEKLGYTLVSEEESQAVVPGLYLAGDLSHRSRVSSAVADGADAAIAIHKALYRQELRGMAPLVTPQKNLHASPKTGSSSILPSSEDIFPSRQ